MNSSSPFSLKSNKKSATAGLRILIQISQGDSNILLLKTYCLKSTKPPTTSSSSGHEYSCFLKSCFLCHKPLNPDKDVYMYKGDQGFCSVECRGRQIFIDEMKEREISAKRILESFRHRRRCETGSLFEEFRRRHTQKDGGAILFSYS